MTGPRRRGFRRGPIPPTPDQHQAARTALALTEKGTTMAMPRRTTGTIDCTCRLARPHGDQHTYQAHRCGCDACYRGYRDYLAALKAGRDAGVGANVDAAPVSDHLWTLTDAGVSMPALAERLGCSARALYKIRMLDRPTCRRWLAEAVMAVPVP